MVTPAFFYWVESMGLAMARNFNSPLTLGTDFLPVTYWITQSQGIWVHPQHQAENAKEYPAIYMLNSFRQTVWSSNVT